MSKLITTVLANKCYQELLKIRPKNPLIIRKCQKMILYNNREVVLYNIIVNQLIKIDISNNRCKMKWNTDTIENEIKISEFYITLFYIDY